MKHDKDLLHLLSQRGTRKSTTAEMFEMFRSHLMAMNSFLSGCKRILLLMLKS